MDVDKRIGQSGRDQSGPYLPIMDVDKRIGPLLADKSAVGCDKSAPTAWLVYFVNVHNRHWGRAWAAYACIQKDVL